MRADGVIPSLQTLLEFGSLKENHIFQCNFFRLVDLGINSMRLYTYQANPRYNWFSGLV